VCTWELFWSVCCFGEASGEAIQDVDVKMLYIVMSGL